MTQPAWLRLPAQVKRLIFAICLQYGIFGMQPSIPQEIYEEMEALSARSAAIEDIRLRGKRICEEGDLRGLHLTPGRLVDPLDPPADGRQHVVRDARRLSAKT